MMHMAESKNDAAAPSARSFMGRCGHLIRVLGPGLITGASDDDPSGISTYSVAGASTGFSMLWVALLTTPMMAVVQGMCARIGMVGGMGLAGALRKTYPRWIVYALAAIVVIANTANVGADMAGMAASMAMVTHVPNLVWVVAFGVIFIAFQVYLPYAKLVSVVKWLTLSLFAYIITAFLVHPPWLAVLASTLVPHLHFDGKWITTLVGVLGTTITPYLFFWQSALMVEDEKAMGRMTLAQRRGATESEIKDAHLDVNAGMILSNLVMFFIIVTTATTLGAAGKHDIASAQDAAEALRPLAGNFAYLLFALGMVGTGLLAVPALAGSSAYVLAETIGFRQGLDEKPHRAKRFYGVIVGGIVIGMVMNFAGVDAIKALFWCAVLNGVAAVPLLVFITHLANNRDVMGRWRNSLAANIWAILTIILMGVAAVLMFVFWNT